MTQLHFYLNEGPYRPQKGIRFSQRFSHHPPEYVCGEKKRKVDRVANGRRGRAWDQPDYAGITLVLYPLTSFAHATSGPTSTVVTSRRYLIDKLCLYFGTYSYGRANILAPSHGGFQIKLLSEQGSSGAAHPYNAGIPSHSNTCITPFKSSVILLMKRLTTHLQKLTSKDVISIT